LPGSVSEWRGCGSNRSLRTHPRAMIQLRARTALATRAGAARIADLGRARPGKNDVPAISRRP
ncbi:MAG: hypothetical protein ACREXY_03325, partial [Gammaproteobacteria bacterium]